MRDALILLFMLAVMVIASCIDTVPLGSLPGGW